MFPGRDADKSMRAKNARAASIPKSLAADRPIDWDGTPLPGLRTLDWPAEVRARLPRASWTGRCKPPRNGSVRIPEDLDARAWHARILGWQGHTSESEAEYRRCWQECRTIRTSCSTWHACGT